MMRHYCSQDGFRDPIMGAVAIHLGKVTLDHDFLRSVAFDADGLVQANNIGATPFKEIRVAEPQMDECTKAFASDREAWSRARCGVPPGSHPFLSTMKEKLKASWDSEAYHVCFHTSGYDSRLISGILMQLREELGEGWLGSMLFLCFEPEGALFKKVMEWEGWKPFQYRIYQEGMGIDYRAQLVDFEHVWKWVNSYCMPWFVLGPAMDSIAFLSDAPVNVLSGMFGNELTTINTQLALVPAQRWLPTVRYPNHLVDRLMDGWYWRRDVTAHWSAVMYEGLSMPLTDVSVAPHVDRTTRLSAIQEISPELLALQRYPDEPLNIPPNWFGPDGRLSIETREKAARDFSNSYYATALGKESQLAPVLGNNVWWREYVLASLCDDLVKHDVKVDLA